MEVSVGSAIPSVVSEGIPSVHRTFEVSTGSAALAQGLYAYRNWISGDVPALTPTQPHRPSGSRFVGEQRRSELNRHQNSCECGQGHLPAGCLDGRYQGNWIQRWAWIVRVRTQCSLP